MEKNSHNSSEDADLVRIVYEKLRMKTDLSAVEQWVYLTRILRVSDEVAEEILHKLNSEPNKAT